PGTAFTEGSSSCLLPGWASVVASSRRAPIWPRVSNRSSWPSVCAPVRAGAPGPSALGSSGFGRNRVAGRPGVGPTLGPRRDPAPVRRTTRPPPERTRVGRKLTVFRRMVIAGALAALALLAVPIATPAGGQTTSYVALGDSYTAGPIIGMQLPDPVGCFRSDHNYPHFVAEALQAPTFRDASCSGAGTDEMTAPQTVNPAPPNP